MRMVEAMRMHALLVDCAPCCSSGLGLRSMPEGHRRQGSLSCEYGCAISHPAMTFGGPILTHVTALMLRLPLFQNGPLYFVKPCPHCCPKPYLRTC